MNLITLAMASENTTTSSNIISSVATQNPGLISMLPFVMIFFIFYFMLIKPQMKKQKELSSLVGNLKKGDKIVTTSGIIAQIVKLEDDILHVEIAPEVKIKITRNSVANIYEVSSNNKEAVNKISK